MSLPSRPWPADKIRALYQKSLRLLNDPHLNRRKEKRSARIAERSFALWFQLKKIDPHAPASFHDTGEGTRHDRRAR